MLTDLSPARRRVVLAVLALVAVGVLVAVVAVVRQVSGGEVVPVAQDEPGPVLVVPGYGGSTDSVQPLAQALERVGRDVTVVELAGDGTGDLLVQAQVLAEAAGQAMARTGAGSVDVVGYSAGGVIARLWVRELDGAGQARRVLMLGTPNHGTDVARLAGALVPSGCPTACRQLEPDSELLRRLNAGDETPAGPEFVTLWTTLDEVVVPPESAAVDGGLNLVVQDICPGSDVRHGGLPEEPLVRAVLASTLGADPPVAPTTCPAQ